MHPSLPFLALAACSPKPGADDVRAKDREAAPAILLADELPEGELPEIDPLDCPGGGPRLVDGWPAYWTVIHYAAGDNNLEKALIDDLHEMELGHGGSENVQVVAQFDYYRERGAERFFVQPDVTAGEIDSEIVGWTSTEPDSGDWRNFASFGEWATTCFPAEQYLVIVGGHGGGWTATDGARGFDAAYAASVEGEARESGEEFRMIAPDYSGSTMSVADLQQALRHIRDTSRREGDRPDLNRLVAYASDVCLMQTAEVAYELRNEARYVIGSEEVEPGTGWPFNTIVRELASRPGHYWESPHEVVEEIVTLYGKAYGEGGSEREFGFTTQSAMDVRNMISIRNRVADIAEGLVLLLDGDEGDALRAHIVEARYDSFTFGDRYTDLGLFLESLRVRLIDAGLMPSIGEVWEGDENWRILRRDIDGLIRAPDAYTADDNGLLNDAIVRTAAGPDYEGAWGLSIFFPLNDCGRGLSIADYQLSDFDRSTGWSEMLERVMDREAAGTLDGRGVATGAVDWQEAAGTCVLRDGVVQIDLVDFSGEGSRAFAQLRIEEGGDLTATDGWISFPESGESEEWEGELPTDAELDERDFAGSFIVQTSMGPVDIEFACDELQIQCWID